MSSQSFVHHRLNEWDENYDEENVDRPSVSTQNGCETLLQENHAYAGNDHHDEDRSHNQSVYAKSSSLMNQHYMSDG
jgi:hypothetical protein